MSFAPGVDAAMMTEQLESASDAIARTTRIPFHRDMMHPLSYVQPLETKATAVSRTQSACHGDGAAKPTNSLEGEAGDADQQGTRCPAGLAGGQAR